MSHQLKKFLYETKEFIRLNPTGEVYVFNDYQLSAITEYLKDEDIDYTLVTADYYKVIKFE